MEERVQTQMAAMEKVSLQNSEPSAVDGTNMSSKRKPSLVVFSGGTAFNSVARQIKNTLTDSVTHVLPVSDDGGSTAEIVRVLGGPAVGDIRSRCLRLSDESSQEARAVNMLLAHRLPSCDSAAAKTEWHCLVEGDHPLWGDISEPYKNTIRAFLVHFHANILRHATQRFDFSNGSIGNYFFAGARIFFRSLEAAIFLYSRVSGIPEESLILPAVCTEDRLTLGAELCDGSVIRGQNEISHPNVEQSPSLSSMRNYVDKDSDSPLPSPIDRVMYLSHEGMTYEHEIRLAMNPRVLSQLAQSDGIVYGMGSLYTSLCPSLVLEGAGESISSLKVPKMLLINGWHDREIADYTAIDCVRAVCTALNRKQSGNSRVQAPPYELKNRASAYVTTLLVPDHGSVYQPEKDDDSLRDLGIQVVLVKSVDPDESGHFKFDAEALVEAIGNTISTYTGA